MRGPGRVRTAMLPAVAAVIGMSQPVWAQGETGRVAWVIDGDTFRFENGECIRIVGIDAPEARKDQAKCPAEIQQGRAATRNPVSS